MNVIETTGIGMHAGSMIAKTIIAWLPVQSTATCPKDGWFSLSGAEKSAAELSRFEARFGVRSPDFYAAMVCGDLDEFDALDDYRMEFVEWLALYKTWLSLDDKYRQLIARQPVAP